MSERTPGKHDSIPELMKPSVAGPYVPPTEISTGASRPAPTQPVAPSGSEKDSKPPENKFPASPVLPEPATPPERLPAQTPPPLPVEALAAAAAALGLQKGAGESGATPTATVPAEGKAVDEKERQIDEAFAKRKQDTPTSTEVKSQEKIVGVSEEKQAQGTAKGSSGLSRGPDGKIQIEKLERTERRSQKAKPKVKLESPVADGEGTGKPPRKPFRYGLEIGAVVAALLVVAVGVFVYLSLRETRVQVAITPGDIQLEPEAWIVYDFSDRIEFVKSDLERRRGPFLESIREAEKNLSAARADLAGREARMRLLREALEQDQAELPKVVGDQQAALRELWAQEGPRLDREFEGRQDQVNRAIQARAQQLGLHLEREDDLNAPEVMVNAFRLALYNAKDGIDPTAERQWAEDQLKAWKSYEESFAKRQDAIREKAVALRAEGAPKLEAIQERISARQLEIDALAGEMKEFEDEVARHEKARAALVEEMRGLVEPFIADLEKTPAEYIHARWPIDHGWKIDVRRLDKEPNLPPGEYRLMLRGNRDGEPVWAFKEFLIEEFQTTQIKFAESDFTPIRALLEGR